MSLSVEQILSLAPDSTSANSGRQLATLAKWRSLGASGSAVWGECQGSGKNPYHTQIDLSEPAFKCSCPSRKFPCKHGIALSLLFSTNRSQFAGSNPPPWNMEWMESRQKRADKLAGKVDGGAPALTDQERATKAAKGQKREEKRESKVADGLVELRSWIEDLGREGFASLQSKGQAYWDAIAARMVDAQAPALAVRLRMAGALSFHANNLHWDIDLAREMASMYLLATSYDRIDELPPKLQHDIRALIGWTTSQDDVLSQSGIVDRWQTLAQKTNQVDRIKSRTTWLRGRKSGKWAQIIQFAAGKQGFEKAYPVGSEFDAEVCYFPGSVPMRALIKRQGPLGHSDGRFSDMPTMSMILSEFAFALSVNPFIERYPMAISGGIHLSDEVLTLRLADGQILPLHHSFQFPWELLASSGGKQIILIGEWDGYCLTPLSTVANRRIASFEIDKNEK